MIELSLCSCAEFYGEHHPECPAQREYSALFDQLATAQEQEKRWQQICKEMCDDCDTECPPECDDYGHAPNCGQHSVPQALKNCRRELATANERLREAVEYLDSNPLNSIGARSILHRKMADALAGSAKAEATFYPGKESPGFCLHCGAHRSLHRSGDGSGQGTPEYCSNAHNAPEGQS